MIVSINYIHKSNDHELLSYKLLTLTVTALSEEAVIDNFDADFHYRSKDFRFQLDLYVSSFRNLGNA